MRYEVRVVKDVEVALTKEIKGKEWKDGTKGIVFWHGKKDTEGFSKRLGSLCSTAYVMSWSRYDVTA